MEAEVVASDGYVVVMRVTHTTHVPSTKVRLGGGNGEHGDGGVRGIRGGHEGDSHQPRPLD
jgi:hypothetical protein